jgi:hypothetical protein
VGGLCLHGRYCFCKRVERVEGALAKAIFLLQPLSFGGYLPTRSAAIWRTECSVLERTAVVFFRPFLFPFLFYIFFSLYSLFLNCPVENLAERVQNVGFVVVWHS